MLYAVLAVNFILVAAVFYLAFFSSRKNDEALRAQYKEDIRSLLELAEQKFETERVRQGAELDLKKQAVETAVGDLSRQLKEYEKLMRSFEEDRNKKYGSIENQLREAGKTSERLTATTEGLRSLLSNSRVRGQWGERMADDILRASGLLENVQYLKNRSQEAAGTRPDFTFLLPDQHRFNMDVKFPFDNYLRMVNAQADEEKARFKADFLRDVKGRIKELQKREYIDPSERTLDYVLLFIPNEQVYGFIQEAEPGLIDEALKQKVVMCSPFTLYAVIAVVRQAFDNFHFSQTNQEALKLISNFAAAYGKFKERFEGLGAQLAKTGELYQDISQTSYRKLDAAIAKIDKVRHGQAELPAAEAIAQLPLR